MASFNSVTLLGNLTRDPEIKYLPSGKAVAEIGLAINESYKNQAGEKVESALFVDVALFGRQAEVAGEYLKKGRPVFIQGRLKLDTWDDKSTGQKRSKMRVVAENMQLLGGKDDQATNQPASRPAARQSAPLARQPAKPPVDPALDADDDDIPF